MNKLLENLDHVEEIQKNLVQELFKSLPQLQNFITYRADAIGLNVKINGIDLPFGLSQVNKILSYQDKELESPSIKSWLVENDLKLPELILIARVIYQIQGQLTLQYIPKEYSRKDYE